MGREKKPAKHGRGEPFWETNRGEPILQKHHITPSSRRGKSDEENILDRVPSDVHWAWHRLFGNRTPPEILDIILKVWFRSGRFINYRTSIEKGTKPPKTMTPDEVVLALTNRVFPEDWVPSGKLVKTIVELWFIGMVIALIKRTFPTNWVPPKRLVEKLEERRKRLIKDI